MSENYTKHLWGASKEVVNNPVKCADADLACSHSGTLEFAKITCSGDAVINVDHSATLIIGELECANLKIRALYSSTLHIEHLTCSGTVGIEIIYSSLFLVDNGDVNRIVGDVNYSSTGKYYATTKRDDVVAKNSSTWLT